MRRGELRELPWVGFRVGEARLAVEASLVRGVAWNKDLLAVPFTHRSVAGVMVRAGRVVPVFDLALVPAAWSRVPPPGGDQIVILGEGEMEAGILAAETATFRAAPPGGPQARGRSQGPLREDMLAGAVSAGGMTFGVLSVPTALAAAGVPKTFSG